MKRILLSTAFAVATAGFAHAQDSDSQIRDLVGQELAGYGTDVQVDQLTDDQVRELYIYATSTDSTSVKHDRYRRVLDEVGDEGGAQYPSRVRAYVPYPGDDDVEPVQVEMPRNQLRSLVGQMLETYEVDVDVSTLTDEQLTELYLIDTSFDSESEQGDRIRAVLND